jgi:DNA repair exonuclease SbcCD ATPase subunit
VVHDSVSLDAVEAIAEQVARSENNPDLTSALRARQFARASRVTAADALQHAIEAPRAKVAVEEQLEVAAQAPVIEEPVMYAPPMPRNHAEAPATVTEVQAPPSGPVEFEPGERRERLRERLRAVRENPRPEPLPETVAEAGVLAVERISALQSELTKSRAMNLALAQDLEAARRQAERATEEARLRMDEARRLSTEMEGRVKLLSDLERELESLESERNEALLALQDSRQALDAGATEKASLQNELAKRDSDLNESLAEEERLASELERAQESMSGLRRAADALKGERDTLARQVSDLTRERAELLEARKALEAVHRALSHAVLK